MVQVHQAVFLSRSLLFFLLPKPLFFIFDRVSYLTRASCNFISFMSHHKDLLAYIYPVHMVQCGTPYSEGNFSGSASVTARYRRWF